MVLHRVGRTARLEPELLAERLAEALRSHVGDLGVEVAEEEEAAAKPRRSSSPPTGMRPGSMR